MTNSKKTIKIVLSDIVTNANLYPQLLKPIEVNLLQGKMWLGMHNG